VGDRLQALTKAGIIRPGRLISHGHAAAADGFKRQSWSVFVYKTEALSYFIQDPTVINIFWRL
jgi:hypothetical protein